MRRANWFKEPVASSLGLQKAGRVGLTRKDLAVLEGEVPKAGALDLPPNCLPERRGRYTGGVLFGQLGLGSTLALLESDVANV